MKPKSKNLVNGIVSFVLTICILMSGGLATVGSYITEGISVYAATVTANDFVWDLSDEGVLTITGTGEMPYYDWNKSSFMKTQVKTVVISKGITSINSMFSDMSNLTTVYLPEGLKKIKEYSFEKCISISSITIPDSVTVIGYRAFCECSRLKNVNYPLNLQETGGEIFWNCPIDSIKIPEGVTEIPQNAFYKANLLQKVKLPGTLRKIGSYSFSNCKDLTSIEIPDSVMKIGYQAFYECSKLQTINYPLNLQETGSEIFWNCPIKSIEIPEGVTEIPQNAFYKANLLQKVKLPDTLRKIGSYSFSNCKNLMSIEIPNSVTNIGYQAFCECSKLQTINYPLNLQETGSEIFWNCPIDGIEIPEGVTEIPQNAFCRANLIQEIKLPGKLRKIGSCSFSNCKNLMSIEIPDSVTNVGYQAFYECSKLQTINYPLNLQETGTEILYNCPIDSIEIPEGVTEIPKYAFYNANLLKEVKLPTTLKTIDESAFDRCTSLKNVDLPDGLETIKYAAFGACKSFTGIHLPDSVKSISPRAFGDCDNLTEINYPLSLQETGTEILYNCPIDSIEIPEGVTEIPKYAFYNANLLKEVKLPKTLKIINESAFDRCSSLKNVDLPDGLETIKYAAFGACKTFTSIHLPDSVKSISSRTFGDCDNLTEINYPLSLQETGSEIFWNCPIDSIEIPEGVTEIPKYAFYNANFVEHIIVPDSVSKIDSYSFYNCPNLTVYVPSYKKYLVDLIDKDIHFVVLNEKQSDDSMIINRDECDYTTSFSSVKNGGSVAITCEYSINSFYSSIKNPYITVRIPNGTELISKTLMYNGKICNTYTDKGKTITIPVEEQKGKITFSVKLIESKDILSYATLNYQMNNKKDYDIIGIINENIPSISISAPSITNTQQVTVSGVAPVGKEVSLYANDKLIDKVMPNKVGAYTASINLPETEDGKTYTLKAVSTDNDSKELFAVTYLQFLTETPTLSSFTLDYNGRNYDLMSKTKPNIVFASSHRMKFTVKFNHPEKVKYVYVTSDRNNVTKRMKAEWDESSKAFIAEGFFDESNHNYVPGKINVYYAEEGSMYSYLENLFDFEVDEEKVRESVNTEIITNTDTDTEKIVRLTTEDGLDCTISEKTSDIESGIREIVEDDEKANEIIKKYQSNSDINDVKESLNEAGVNQVYIINDDQLGIIKSPGKFYAIQRDASKKGTVVSFMLDTAFDTAGGEAIGYLLKGIVKNFTSTPSKLSYAKDLGGAIWSAGYGLYQIYDYTSDVTDAMNRMRYSIEHSNYTPEEKQRMYAQLKTYEDDLTTIQISEYFFTIANVALAFSGLSFGTSLLVGIGIGLIHDISVGSLEDELKCLLGLSDDYSINWCIDPSGYVYEGVTSNRLPNVKATACWIPFDEEKDDETFWDKPQTDRAELWKAEEWSQQNPLITDNDGNYAWDVPEGWWQVKYELDGYENVYSEWLPVPPPQTDVHIGMISLKTPNVVSAEITDDGLKIVFDSYMNPETIGNVVLKSVLGQDIEYTVDFGTEETDLDRKVFAKEFLFKLSEESKIKSVIVPNTVLNYCGKHSGKFTKEFVVESEGIFGDTNSDESVDIADALMIARYDAGLIQLDELQLSVSDVNKDDSVDIADALMIARYDAGLISSL